jgi:hypothetical protein
MHKFIADIFTSLLILLHVIIAIVIVLVIAYKPGIPTIIVAIAAAILYVVIVGFISVVLSMHENLKSILNILEKNTNQSKPVTENVASNVDDRNTRLEPKI